MRGGAARRDEDGVGTVLVLALVGVLVFLALVASGTTAIVVGHRRAQLAADLAALAGAAAAQDGRDPCAAAADQAARNGATGQECAVDGPVVRVVVRVVLPAALGHREVRARARAGPADG